MKKHVRTVCAVVATGLMLAANACGTQLIVNGGFEAGTLEGWTQLRMHGGNTGGFFADNDAVTPVTGHTTVGAARGSYYAVADQSGPGATVLLQTFSVEAGDTAILSFALFVNNHNATAAINPAGLVWNAAPNQHVRVDILRAGSDPFSTAAADVLGNFYLGADTGGNPHNYTAYSFDVTSIVAAGGTFQLRFAEVSNQSYLTLGIDEVSIIADRIAVPEPPTIALVSCGLLLAAGRWIARRSRQ